MKLVCFSDQHGKLCDLPDGDLYLCAGDVCPDFGPGSQTGSALQEKWLREKWVPWVGNRNLRATFGNHDFVSRHFGLPFYVDKIAEVDGVNIWMSPWSNTFGGWAWMKPPSSLGDIYALIPDDTDVIVSHQPPYGYGDRVPDKYLIYQDDGDAHVGSKELLAVIDRVQPKLVVCGHIHNGRGEYQRGDTRILNVALVNEEYHRVYDPVEVEL